MHAYGLRICAAAVFTIPLVLVVAAITITLAIVSLTLFTILFAIRRHGRRYAMHMMTCMISLLHTLLFQKRNSPARRASKRHSKYRSGLSIAANGC